MLNLCLLVSYGEEVGVAARDGEVRWQGAACRRLGWAPETGFTAAALLDRLLHRVRIPPRYLHAVGAAALFIAAKIHEEDENVPATIEVVERGGMDCSHRELLRMERVLLDKLSWHPKASITLDFLQVLHALAIVSAPKHQQAQRSGSPTRQLGHLTNRLWRVVCSGRSGSMRPSLLSLALLSLALDTSASEPGLTLWLQALTQVSDEELASARALVKEILGEESLEFLPVPPSQTSQHSPPSRPNKRKVGHSLDTEEEDMYVDIKKLYAYDKTATETPLHEKSPEGPEELDDTYSDIRRLYSPVPIISDPLAASKMCPTKPASCKKLSSKKKKTKPTFKAKNSMKSSLKQALKIPCKISLITTKKIFEEICEEEEEEEDEMEMEVENEESQQEWEGPLVEPVGILNSPIFSPMSPEFPDIRNVVVKKEDLCWRQKALEVTEQVYRPMTYAQVLRLHLTPLTRALGV
ncbi:cyclin-I-like [Penaeus monodon]|uniref:cyclin-I-like n=1 Tax=Penaeus monodon TaxID=6687 RepID=UPI0018A6E7A3|nr:cyclin-I-like [Penaeus monodon]